MQSQSTQVSINNQSSPWVGQGVLLDQTQVVGAKVEVTRPAYLRRQRKHAKGESVKFSRHKTGKYPLTIFQDPAPILDQDLMDIDSELNTLTSHQNFSAQDPENDTSLLSEFWANLGMRMTEPADVIPAVNPRKIQVLSGGMQVISE